MIDKRTGLTSD